MQVILRERDLVLARRLWEAGEKAAGRPIVGIIGAGHVQVCLWRQQPKILGKLETCVSDCCRPQGERRAACAVSSCCSASAVHTACCRQSGAAK